MRTSQKQTSKNGEGKLTSSPEAFPASLFPTQAIGGGRKTSVTSGQRCAALYKKSGPLGSLVRTLLELPLWSKEGYSLRWETQPLCSKRVTSFTDTNLSNPSPSNASAETLNTSDIQSSRCLFRLRLSELPIDETESSLLPMMQTPTAVMTCESPEKMRERAKKNGYQNGTKFGSLESQLMYDKRLNHLLPTPRVGGQENYETRVKRKGHIVAMSYLESAVDFLTQKGMLPTPSARDWKPTYNPDAMVRKDGKLRNDMLSTIPTQLGLKERGGTTFQLSPLFTEEMMGFPLGWTELPFLSPNGEPKA